MQSFRKSVIFNVDISENVAATGLTFPYFDFHPGLTPIQNNSKIIGFCILIFMFQDERWKNTKILNWMVESIPWIQFSLTFFVRGMLIIQWWW
jgi:hypothetical protein